MWKEKGQSLTAIKIFYWIHAQQGDLKRIKKHTKYNEEGRQELTHHSPKKLKRKEKKYLGGTTNKTLLLLAFSHHFYTNQSTNIQPKIGVI